MKLTKSQKIGLEKILNWVNDDKSVRTITLSGFAGTGKTTLLKFFLEKYRYRVAVTAPTHKAVSVISNILNRPGVTLHSLHGLRPNVNLATFDINNVQFDPLGEPKLEKYSLIIVDEASMINAGLYALNEQRAETFNVRIIYMGDELQLPPVGERLSKVFLTKNIITLNEVVRQEKENPISTLLELVRQDIRNNSTYLCINYILQNPINIKVLEDGEKHGYALLSREQFNDKLLDEFPSVMLGKQIKYYAYTNENVMEVNSYIRNNLIKSSDIITKGDLLISNVNTYDEYQAILLSNSSEYKVESVEYMESDYGFNIYVCDLIDVVTNKLINAVKIVDHKDTKSWKVYSDVLKQFYNNAINSDGKNRGRNWRNYYGFKTQYLQMMRLSMGRNKHIERDLNYGYATTIHKAQGDTVDISYINLKDVALTKDNEYRKNNHYNRNNIEFINRLIYVALSRARYKTILLWI